MNLYARESMHKLASSYSSSKQNFLQEAVYHNLPELWLTKSFPRRIFVNTGITSKRIQICKSMVEIEALNPDSTDFFKRNMLGRPKIRYKNGMYDPTAICDVIKQHCVVFLFQGLGLH